MVFEKSLIYIEIFSIVPIVDASHFSYYELSISLLEYDTGHN